MAAQKAKHELQLLYWLQQINLDTYYTKLLSHGIYSVERLTENLQSDILKEIVTVDDFKKLQEAVEKQQGSFSDSLPVKSALVLFSFSWWSIKFVGEFIYCYFLNL